MRPLPLIAVLGALLVALAPPAAAVTVDGLYRTQVEVAGKGEEARSDGFRRALEQILVKVSGSRATASNPDLEEVLDNPARYVQQYSYEALEGAGTAEGGDGDSGAPTHRLLVTFSGSLVERALRERGVVVWGERRPEVLVWLAVDEGSRRYLLSTDDNNRVHELLSVVAERRGLPVMLPLLDTADRSRIEFIDVKGGFFDAVRSASERYRADTLLVGHLERRAGRWTGDWNLIGVGERRSWHGTHPGLDAALDAGVGGAAERVAAALAGQDGERSVVHLRVRDLAGLDAYARVAGYLESLVRVRTADVIRVRPHEAVFRVAIQGRVPELERAIELGNVLRPAPADIGRRDDGAAIAAGTGEPVGTAAGAGEGDTRSQGGATTTGLQDDGGAAASGGGPADATDAAPAHDPGPPELVYRLLG